MRFKIYLLPIFIILAFIQGCISKSQAQYSDNIKPISIGYKGIAGWENIKIEYIPYDKIKEGIINQTSNKEEIKRKLDAINGYTKGGIVVISIYRSAIIDGTYYNFEYIVQDLEGNILTQKEAQIRSESVQNTTSKHNWRNIDIVYIPNDWKGDYLTLFIVDKIHNTRNEYQLFRDMISK